MRKTKASAGLGIAALVLAASGTARGAIGDSVLFSLSMTVSDQAGRDVTYSSSSALTVSTYFGSMLPSKGNGSYMIVDSSLYGTLSGPNANNQTAAVTWMYSPSSGFKTFGLHTANANGLHTNPGLIGVTGLGQVVGFSTRYSSTSTLTNTLGSDAWVYNPETNTNTTLGLTGANYSYNYSTTTASGSITGVFQSSIPSAVTSSGLIAGTSNRYAGGAGTNSPSSTSLGAAAWLYNPSSGSTVEIGLNTAGYYYNNSATGLPFYSNSISGISSSGRVIGTATIYPSTSLSSSAGTEAWIAGDTGNGVVTKAFGLHLSGLAPVQFGSNSYSYSYDAGGPRGRSTNLTAINSSGQVAARTYVYLVASGSNYRGMESFIYTPSADLSTGTYRVVGLYDSTPDANGTTFISPAINGSNAGSRISTISFLNDAGESVGSSTVYSTLTTSSGQAAWYAPASGATREIGLRGLTQYYNGTTNRLRNVVPSQLTQTGLVGGFSSRYANGTTTTSLGQDAWVYDSKTNITYTIDPDHAASDSLYAFSRIYSLSDTGYAGGAYAYKPSPLLSQTPNKAFFWSKVSGLIDLTPAVTALGFSDTYAAQTLYVSDDATTLYVLASLPTNTQGVLSLSVASKWTANSASWNDAANWANGTVPNGAGALAVFPATASAPTTVTAAAGTVVGSMNFAGANSYTVAGSDGISVSGAYSGQLIVQSGHHTVSAPLMLASSVEAQVKKGASLSVTSMNPTDLGDRSHTLTVTGGGTLILNAYVGGAIAVVDSLVDLRGEAVISNQSEASLRSLAQSWWNGGQRNGNGLGSLLALAGSGRDALATIAVTINDRGDGTVLHGEFAGAPASATDVLAMYTYIGDTNLDGEVDDLDLARTLVGIRGSLTGWSNGDTNYDGVVNGDDLANLLRVMRLQGAPFTGGTTGGAAGGVVPEPAMLSLIGLPAILLGRRRRI